MAPMAFSPLHCLIFGLLLVQLAGSVAIPPRGPSNQQHEQEPSKAAYIVYTDHLAKPSHFATHELWYTSMVSSLSPSAANDSSSRVFYLYDTVAHGFAAELTADEAQRLSNTTGVSGVFEDGVMQLHTTRSPSFLGLDRDFGILPDTNFGDDVIIGFVDTGIWPESASFVDDGLAPSAGAGRAGATTASASTPACATTSSSAPAHDPRDIWVTQSRSCSTSFDRVIIADTPAAAAAAPDADDFATTGARFRRRFPAASRPFWISSRLRARFGGVGVPPGLVALVGTGFRRAAVRCCRWMLRCCDDFLDEKEAMKDFSMVSGIRISPVGRRPPPAPGVKIPAIRPPCTRHGPRTWPQLSAPSSLHLARHGAKPSTSLTGHRHRIPYPPPRATRPHANSGGPPGSASRT
nr:unnamed protein product [Digitaria exilis]